MLFTLFNLWFSKSGKQQKVNVYENFLIIQSIEKLFPLSDKGSTRLMSMSLLNLLGPDPDKDLATNAVPPEQMQ